MGLIFRQMFDKESSTYTYILADDLTREALVIDPVIENFKRDCQIINELQVDLKYALETHIHADHITAAGQMKKQFQCLLVIGNGANVETADLKLGHKESVSIGKYKVEAIHTPGHTEGCTSYYLYPYLFTGDALLIRGCGRTDFQGGDSETLFDSVRNRLFSLPDSTLVYPAHDYKGRTCSSVEEEKNFNPRLKLEKSLEDFVEIMKNLKMSPPEKIKESVPANKKSGLVE